MPGLLLSGCHSHLYPACYIRINRCTSYYAVFHSFRFTCLDWADPSNPPLYSGQSSLPGDRSAARIGQFPQPKGYLSIDLHKQYGCLLRCVLLRLLALLAYRSCRARVARLASSLRLNRSAHVPTLPLSARTLSWAENDLAPDAIDPGEVVVNLGCVHQESICRCRTSSASGGSGISSLP